MLYEGQGVWQVDGQEVSDITITRSGSERSAEGRRVGRIWASCCCHRFCEIIEWVMLPSLSSTLSPDEMRRWLLTSPWWPTRHQRHRLLVNKLFGRSAATSPYVLSEHLCDHIASFNVRFSVPPWHRTASFYNVWREARQQSDSNSDDDDSSSSFVCED